MDKASNHIKKIKRMKRVINKEEFHGPFYIIGGTDDNIEDMIITNVVDIYDGNDRVATSFNITKIDS